METTTTWTADSVLLGATPAQAAVMEKRSVTAPGYRSAHGTGLPFAGSTGLVLAALLSTESVSDVVPAPPPRGTQV